MPWLHELEGGQKLDSKKIEKEPKGHVSVPKRLEAYSARLQL
jgi:hypothetical protein